MSIAQILIFAIALWVGGMVYVIGIEKQENFRKRFLGCLAVYVVVTGAVWLCFSSDPFKMKVIGRITGFLCIMILLHHCWKLSWSVSVYNMLWAAMSWQLFLEIWMGLTGILEQGYGENAKRDFWLCIFVFAFGYTALAFTIARWMPEERKPEMGPRQLGLAIVIFITFEVIGYAPGNVEMNPGDGKWMIIYLSQILMVVILYLQSELFKKSAMRQELAVMNMLLKKEKEQYELSKENISIMNQKCHDLKHLIRAIRDMDKDEVEQYLKEVEDSVQIYEAIVKTGNEALDMILTEKSLYCRERGILISCVADGSQMGFMNTIDLYALLGNALDNAIEAVEKFTHKEKRQIDVLIYRQQKFLVINIINPSKEKLIYEEELPVTSKGDRYHHGFGLKSIRYIVKKYDGALTISEEDGCFSLKILIPIPNVNLTST